MQKRFKDNKELLPLFSKDYWAASVADLTDLRKICIAALLVGLSVVLQSVSVPLTSGLRLQVTFFLSALGGAMLGPILSTLRGAAADVLGAILFPQGAFFFGYTLSAMLSAVVYSLFFYRKRITVWRVILAKMTVSFGVNALIGSIWSTVIYGSKSYGAYLLASLAKQVVLLPLEVAVIALLFASLTPPLSSLSLIPKQEGISFSKRALISVIVLTLLVAALLILTFAFPDFTASVFKSILDFVKSIFGIK